MNIKDQLSLTLEKFEYDSLGKHYKGKVRDVYKLKNDLVIMIASDRISAFDVVMPRGIPYKGQILNQIATQMMDLTKDIVPNWLISSPSILILSSLNLINFLIISSTILYFSSSLQ